jgi:hypothetical protein
MPGAAKVGKINAEHEDNERERAGVHENQREETRNSLPTGGNA